MATIPTPNPPSNPTDEPDAPPGELIAHFRGFVRSWRSGRYGETIIQLVVPHSSKYDALPVTDHAGLMFDVYFVDREPIEETNNLRNYVLADAPVDEGLMKLV
ncbi:MAG: hypothetical protein KatS3mg015_2951 [Fimbriimonadales bacterium]|nr:MAG: hypothetical protein KatS3mg015_2951 [Fimbriimonadales bacterium]